MKDVEHVEAVGFAALGIRVGEVCHDVGIFSDDRVDILDGELGVLGHRTHAQVGKGDQRLLLGEDQFEEVFIDHGAGWYIELHYMEVRRYWSLTYTSL